MSSQSAGIGSLLPQMNANTSAQVLTNDGVTASWEDAASAGLPPQGGNSGKLLTTNGSAASWAAVTADSLLPAQSGKTGYFLASNGTTVGWSVSLTALLPTQTGHSGELLSTDGAGTLSWASASGLTLAAVGSTPNANALTLTGSALNVQPADGTYGGVVSTTTQTFAGVKTFSDVPVAAGISAPTTSTLTLSGNRTDGGTNVGVVIDNLVALTTAGAKIVSFQNHEAEKASIGLDGTINTNGPVLSIGNLVSTSAVTAEIGTMLSGAAVAFGYGAGSSGGALLLSDLSYLSVQAPVGPIYLKVGPTYYVTLSTTVLDLTTLNAGGHGGAEIGAIKMKSPSGTTYTASIADGGTWTIS